MHARTITLSPFENYEHIENWCGQQGVRLDVPNEAWQMLAADKRIRYPTEIDGVRQWQYFTNLDFDSDSILKIGSTGETPNGSVCVKWEYDGKSHGDKGNSAEQIEIIKQKSIEAGLHVSTSFSDGLHCECHFKQPIPTANRAEHKLLAHVMLDVVVQRAWFDFREGIDHVGEVLWDWKKVCDHPKQLISKGQLFMPPDNWQSRLIAHRAHAVKKSSYVNEAVPLDAEHQRLLDWLSANNKYCQPITNGFKTHTSHLLAAHQVLGLRGKFSTNTSNKHVDNCVMYPRLDGAWFVSRLGGHAEDGWHRNKDEHGMEYGNYFTILNPAPL